MIITADERRNILGLFNISETARELGVPVGKMHWDITAGHLPAPRVRLEKRAYYGADDVNTPRTAMCQKNKPLVNCCHEWPMIFATKFAFIRLARKVTSE